MEDVLDVYEIPYNQKKSVVCMDEKPYQLLGEVREHRTSQDWAEEIKYLVDVSYPNVNKIVLVMNNLNTHAIASLYKTFQPVEARRIVKRLELHYTPKHGSWLDIAEIELNVMTRQCLYRRIGNIDILSKELSAWEAEHNKNGRFNSLYKVRRHTSARSSSLPSEECPLYDTVLKEPETLLGSCPRLVGLDGNAN